MPITDNKKENDIRPVFITYPTLYSLLMLNYFIYKKDIKFAGIILSTSHIKMKAITFSLLESFYILIRKSGLWYALYMFLHMKCAYIITAAWQIAARLAGKNLKFRTFGRIVREQKIPCLKTTNINRTASVDFMKSVNANMIVSGYNNQILRYSVCKKFPYRAINIHNAYLPDFGGLDASFEVLYEEVRTSGATIHHVDKGIDTGKIIAQEKITVSKDDTVFSLNIRQWMQGAMLLPRVLDSFRMGSVDAKAQDPKAAKYQYKSFPAGSRVKEFLKSKKRLIGLREIFIPRAHIYKLFEDKEAR